MIISNIDFTIHLQVRSLSHSGPRSDYFNADVDNTLSLIDAIVGNTHVIGSGGATPLKRVTRSHLRRVHGQMTPDTPLPSMLQKLRDLFGDSPLTQTPYIPPALTKSAAVHQRKRPRHIALDIHDDDTLISTSQPLRVQPDYLPLTIATTNTDNGGTERHRSTGLESHLDSRSTKQHHRSSGAQERLQVSFTESHPSPRLSKPIHTVDHQTHSKISLPRNDQDSDPTSTTIEFTAGISSGRPDKPERPPTISPYTGTKERARQPPTKGPEPNMIERKSPPLLRQMPGYISRSEVEKLISKSIAPVVAELKKLRKEVALLENRQTQASSDVMKKLEELKVENKTLWDQTKTQMESFKATIDGFKPILLGIQKSIAQNNSEILKFVDRSEPINQQSEALQLMNKVQGRGKEQLGAIDEMTTKLAAVSHEVSLDNGPTMPLSSVLAPDLSGKDRRDEGTHNFAESNDFHQLSLDFEGASNEKAEHSSDPSAANISIQAEAPLTSNGISTHSPDVPSMMVEKPVQQVLTWPSSIDPALSGQSSSMQPKKAIVISKEEADRKAVMYRRRKKVRRKIADYFQDAIKLKAQEQGLENLLAGHNSTNITPIVQPSNSFDEAPQGEQDTVSKKALQLKAQNDITEFAAFTTCAIQLNAYNEKAALSQGPNEFFAKLRWMIDYVKSNLQFPSLNGIPPHQVHSWLRLVFYFATIFNVPKGTSFTCNESCEFSVDLFVTDGIADIENNWAAHSPDCQYQQKAIDMLVDVDHVGKPMHWVMDEIAKMVPLNLEQSRMKEIWKLTFDRELSEEALAYLVLKCRN